MSEIIDAQESPANAPSPNAPTVANTNAPAVQNSNIVLSGEAWLDRNQYTYMYKVAQTYASSSLMPDQFKNKPADVLIVMQLAARRGLDPWQALQNIHIVKGKPFLSTSYAIYLANTSGIFRGRIKFQSNGEGDALAVTAYATLAETGTEVRATATMAMAKAEKWTANDKYKSMPEQMLSYRAALFLIRLHAPEALFGTAIEHETEVLETQNPADTLRGKLRG